jgi:protein-S-isoprenylcysteine O-methyltransferase Ste14
MQFAVATKVGTPALRWRRYGSMVQDACLVVVSALFFYLQAVHVVSDHSASSVGFAAEQAMLVGMFLTRRRSYATSTRLLDWVVAAGAWLPLAARPVSGEAALPSALGIAIQVIGLSLTLVCFSALGRSFGVVAANRGLKVHGPYRLVRHPIYFSHFVTLSGFLVANFSPYNVAILGVVAVCQVMRIRAEERVLVETADYAAYRARVRWRLVPGVY